MHYLVKIKILYLRLIFQQILSWALLVIKFLKTIFHVFLGIKSLSFMQVYIFKFFRLNLA